MKMEQIECSETSAYKIQTPGNHPEENIQHTEHGESFKSKILQICYQTMNFFTKKIQQDATMYQNFISYLYEAQHVSGDTPPIIRSLKLHWQPLVLHTWRVVGRVVVGR
jgi:hypothetical protein